MTAPAVRSLAPGQRRTILASATALLIVFVALALAARAQYLVGIDTAAHALIQPARHASYPTLGTPIKLLASLGSGYFLLPVALVGCLGLSLRHRRLAVLVLATAALAPLVQLAAKVLVARPRPHLTAYGFPSGHVFGATIFFGLVVYLAWALGPTRGWRRAATLIAVLAVAGVAGNRLYVNVHWVSDVVGGLSGGAAYVLGAILVLDRHLHGRSAEGGAAGIRAGGSG